jgi:ABC-type transport system involved in cytochrome c biogenesis permease subunit
MIIGLVSLLILVILINAFYPIITSFTGGLDPTIQLMVNLVFIIMIVALIISIILDSTRGQSVEYSRV